MKILIKRMLRWSKLKLHVYNLINKDKQNTKNIWKNPPA